MSGQLEYDNDPNIICLNDAVVLHSNRQGVVRYISDKRQDRIAVGIELTEPNPHRYGFADVSKLFACKPNHGILIPLSSIARKIMPEELLMQLQIVTNKVKKYHKQIEELRNKIVQNENQYAQWITNQFLYANNNNNRYQNNNVNSNNTNTTIIHQQKHHRNHNNEQHKNRQRDYISHRAISNNNNSNNNPNNYNINMYNNAHSLPKTAKSKTQSNRRHNNEIDFYIKQQYQDPNNTLSMSLNLKNEKRLHGIPTFTKRCALEYDEKDIDKFDEFDHNIPRKQKIITASSHSVERIKERDRQRRNNYLFQSDGTSSKQSHFSNSNNASNKNINSKSSANIL